MSGRHHSCRQQNAGLDAVTKEFHGAVADPSLIDPHAFGLAKAAYGVRETIELLSIGRTSLYAAVRRGELTPVKFGKKTLFYAVDLAAFLARLKEAAAKSHAPSGRRRRG
jgi:excisionase family DNA binding protein